MAINVTGEYGDLARKASEVVGQSRKEFDRGELIDIDELEDALEAFEKFTRWIPTSEFLPKDEDPHCNTRSVWATTVDGDVFLTSRERVNEDPVYYIAWRNVEPKPRPYKRGETC